jgi:hypothetical protein
MGMKRHAAYALLGLALAGHGEADPSWAVRVHGAADQSLAALGHTLQPLEARLARLDRPFGIKDFFVRTDDGNT